MTAATEKQIEWLKKIGIDAPEGMTKEEAWELIKKNNSKPETINPIMNAKLREAVKSLGSGIRPDPATPKRKEAYDNPVTDLRYRMDQYLSDNLKEVPKFLNKAWDCVIIVSGNAKVRIGKSTMALQIAYYLAWLLNENNKKNGLVSQDNPVPFDNTNVVFDPEALMKTAEKKPKHSVLVYDEGRAGLDSARAMENINKAMQDFFQECGQYGHVIIIVLPDFFKLNETIAIPRSLFLINCYTDKNYNRGFFSFYSERKKELLYIIGKKKWGSSSKYLAVDHNFYGKFSDYFPINKEEYDEQKKQALKKRRKTRLEVRWHLERDIAWWILKNKYSCEPKDIAEEMKRFPDMKVSESVVNKALAKTKRWLQREHYEDDDEEEQEK